MAAFGQIPPTSLRKSEHGVAQMSGAEADQQAETRHKVANIFQQMSTLTRLRSQRAADPASRRDLSWVLDMQAALALLHHRLLSPGGEDFGVYLQDVGGYWRRLCAGRPITIDIEVAAEPVTTEESRASALALIANELVLNALAHAYPNERPGVIRVALKRVGDDRAELVVSDDGDGYDPAAVDNGRLGLWFIGGLAAQVRGELTTAIDRGVRCRLEFPVSQP
jgi:two-component sensor histidine kinase